MSRKTFAYQPKPFIVNVIQKETPAAAIANIHNADLRGVTAHDLHLNTLKPEYHTREHLKRICDSTPYPILALYYRWAGSPSDEERISAQLTAIEAGAAGADIPAFVYDENPRASLASADPEKYPFVTANPNEVAMAPETIARQKALIGKIHGMGGEVLMSAHVGVELSRVQAVSLALELQSRGADVVKIVTTCATEDHFAEMTGTIAELNRIMEKPFIYFATGRTGRLTRVIGPMLGACLCFCNLEYGERSTPDQPTVDMMFDLLNKYKGYWYNP
ncbi:MAG: type I 3-dehydroquinate dehydratase [Clostridiales bacterium]|nr:type I 3-dehydroquinate dehydratase [Clostridiales bacterium]